MLALYIITGFFAALALVWGIWSTSYIDSVKEFQGFANAGAFELSGVIMSAVLPIILIIFTLAVAYIGYFIYKYRSDVIKTFNHNKIVQDNLEAVSKRLIESSKFYYASEFLRILPIAIDDISNLLTDIIVRGGLASELVIKSEMEKSANNRMLALCNIIIDSKDNTPHFEENLRRKIKRNESLKGAIEQFKKRYNKLSQATQKYDKDKFLYDFIEEGVLGKTYLIIDSAFHMAQMPTEDNGNVIETLIEDI